MDFLPIYLDIRHKPCLVVGGGGVALRKIELLLRANADLTVIAPRFIPAIQEKLPPDRRLEKTFSVADLDGFFLVIAATDSRETNQTIARAAQSRGILVNTVDQPDACDFIMPAIVDRSPVLVAISSGGKAPVLARLLRARLESLIPANFGRLAELAGQFRHQVKQKITRPDLRRHFWERTLQGAGGELMLSGQEEAAQKYMTRALKDASENNIAMGYVALVGAGPGDPDLLTFRALRLLQEADVVVYDRLVTPAILNLIRRDAEKIYAGKARSRHTLPQEKINHLLARLAKEGKRVVRLKGGDPFIFGRGGEEIETLAEQGIPFLVVPGITAASGCAAYAGIPLTHRDYAQSCLFVTGHRKNDRPNLDWEKLIVPRQTLVIYMGMVGLEEICHALIAHGMSPEMPAALVQQGTTPEQKVIVGTVATLPGQAKDAHPPTLIIIGKVVTLRSKLEWFQGKTRE